MSHIFISYSRKDLTDSDGVIKNLVARLRRNFHIWIDKAELKAGTNWKQALESAISSSSALLLLLSPNSLDSEWVESEIDTARAKGKPVIPFVYRATNLPFGLSSTHAIFYETDDHPLEKLEQALQAVAPDTWLHSTQTLANLGWLGKRDLTFGEAAQQMTGTLSMTVNLDPDEVVLVGLPVKNSTFCSSYLLGRRDDSLGYQGRVQLALQFSGTYSDANFPIQIARHFLKTDPSFSLRMLLVRGPGQISYDEQRNSYSVQYELERPTEGVNQWQDALQSVRDVLEIYHIGRESPGVQLFVQGPVAGITYELGAVQRGLHYLVEHYQFDRAKREYYRVLGSL